MSNNPTIFKALEAFVRQSLPAGDCLLCGARAGSGLLCEGCIASLPPLPPARCAICALPLPSPGPCGACLKRPPHFEQTIARWAYGFPLDTLVHLLKFSHRLPVADFFATALLESTIPAGDLLLPVPVSAERLRERGFNQSVEIAKVLGRHLGLPVSIHDCLRTTDTAPQSSLPWTLRRKNMRNAFESRRDFSGAHIVVVDDVMTTGATLDELARTLKKHGAVSVTNWVVARAVRHE